MLLELLIVSVLVMLTSLLGVVTVWKQVGSFFQKNLNYLVSFAAGVFLILVIHLSEEVVVHASSTVTGLLWILGGLVLVSILVRILPEGHHHHSEKEETPHTKIDARNLLIGDSLHNIGDGVLLAATFISNPALGVTAATSIIFHEMVQEISEFFVLRQAGYDTKGALRINFLTASTILIGSVGGYFFLETFNTLEIPILGLATGALLALLLQDLLPHSLQQAQDKKCIHKHIIAAILGGCIMFGIFSLTTDESHTHGYEDTQYKLIQSTRS